MPEPEKRSRLAEWGSRPMTGWEKVLFSLVGLAFLAGAWALFMWAADNGREEREELEELLNARYEETISISLSRTRGHTRDTIVLDGAQRPDCKATEDGYLECSDDPQPTLEDD